MRARPGIRTRHMGLEDQLFTMKFASKQMTRKAARCEKEELEQKAMLKKALQKNNIEGAKIYANNAIRKRNEALNYLRLSARFDGVAAQIQSAVSNRMVSKTMGQVVSGLEKAFQNNNLEQISMMMDKFEDQCENLGVQEAYMEGTMMSTSAMSTPSDQVENLIMQVADEHGLEVKMALGSAPTETSEAIPQEQNDELTQRLNMLRNA